MSELGGIFVIQDGAAVTRRRRTGAGTAPGDGPAAYRATALGRLALHPLVAICALQAALSLTLVWSNTAYTDEAYYLWVGHLEIARLLHGASLPQGLFEHNLSGSPVIYPPLGALADGLGGLAAARILSLVFMLAATVLLYRTATRLFGQAVALTASALWLATEPVMRLAFATFDAMSVSLIALSAWLTVEAAFRGHRRILALASAASLALSNATAYSGIVMVPIVVIFALVVWFPRMPGRQAVTLAATVICGWLALFSLLITISGSWSGLIATVLNRAVPYHMTPATLLALIPEAYGYSIYLIVVLAVAGVVVALAAERKQASLPLLTLACATLVVPAGYIRLHTATSIDKHLAYGLWFGAIAGGYAIARLIALPSARLRPFLAASCALALLLPLSNSWDKAWATFHTWANSSSFVSALKPVVDRTNGAILVPAKTFRIDHVAEYYTGQPGEWKRWVLEPLRLNPGSMAPRQIESSYVHDLAAGKYSIVILAFYARRRTQVQKLSSPRYLRQSMRAAYTELAEAVPPSPGLRGLSYTGYLLGALEADSSYRLIAVGPYAGKDTPRGRAPNALYAIWESTSR